MYLLAVKSFIQFCDVSRVVVLSDGSLTDRDRQLICAHIPSVDFRSMASVNRGVCQQGGCWERLCLLGELNASSFVIQLDSDTLTLSKPDALLSCVTHSKSFVMPGDIRGNDIRSVHDAASEARATGGQGFQLQVESRLDELPVSPSARYVRGCAALTGFAARAIDINRVEEIHQHFAKLVGAEAWKTWGSEQVASNYLVANAPNVSVLPVAAYCSHFGDAATSRYDSASILHFIGSNRFDNGTYRRLAARVLGTLLPF
jgi:hypothetical protein